MADGSHGALHHPVVVTEGALEDLVQGCVFLDDNLLRALLSPPHGGTRLL